MNLSAQLKQQLKTLKLSGIVNTLDIRLMEVQQNQISYTEFLAMLLQDELESRNQNRFKKLLKSSGIGIEKTIESFDFSAIPSINPTLIRELATCQFIYRGENVFFIGPTGTGKTHLAKALCHQACRMFMPALFFSFYSMIDQLIKADLVGEQEKLLKKICQADLLVLDDFAMKKISYEACELLYTIIETRQSVKSLIITSNRAIVDWGAVFPDQVIANTILDRIAHNAHQIISEGQSYRRHFRPQNEIS